MICGNFTCHRKHIHFDSINTVKSSISIMFEFKLNVIKTYTNNPKSKIYRKKRHVLSKISSYICTCLEKKEVYLVQATSYAQLAKNAFDNSR